MPNQPPLAFVLHPDGSITDLPKRRPTLEELQAAVGGYIEHLSIKYLERRGQMFLNEEGKLHHLPINFKATAIARSAGIADSDFVVGSVVILIGREVQAR